MIIKINKTVEWLCAAFLILHSLLFTSCSLDREDFTEISPETFPKTETDLKLAVNALYYHFSAGEWGAKCINSADYGGYQVMSDLTTDALWTCWGWESDDLHYHQWHAAMTGSVANYCYNNFSHYQFLSSARNTIRRIEASDAPSEAKVRYAAEAHALRGWMALYLYDMFGPVPVASDAVLDSPESFVYLPRLTDEEYDQMMETDLRTAISGLPESGLERGRVTKGAAMTLLLKYYMIRGFYDKAETLCRELEEMEGRVYGLQSDYARIFSKEGMGNNEIILSLSCTNSSTWLANHLTAEVLPADMPWTEKSTGWGGYVMPWDFYNTFETGDKRLKDLVYTQYTNVNGQLMTKDNSTQLSYGALPLKYGKDPDMTDAHSGIDVVVYRYADILLTLAECIVRNTGSVTSEAINLVNRVRNRAGLSALSDTQTASTDAFMDAILTERGHEFYLEGLRRQDLIRFGKYVEYANQRIADANASGKSYFPVTEGHNRFFIPQTFIDESKSAIKQNAGY